MKTEILWKENPKTDFFEDLKAFATSLDFYQIVIEVDKPNENKYLFITEEGYEILLEPKSGVFVCPVCENISFDVLEGIFQEKPALGLFCLNCETYGAVFPDGM